MLKRALGISFDFFTHKFKFEHTKEQPCVVLRKSFYNPLSL